MSTHLTVIDGSQGEGGGQIFRSALTLAMCLGKAVHIKGIRAGRETPGLLRQHLACLRAAQTICNAEITGDELGSMEVSFTPGKVKAGEYHFTIGSAGSTGLLFQTVLLPLLFAEDSSELVFEGFTHNGYAPSFDFIQRCFLPTLKRMAYSVDVELERFGFYPAGGGVWQARIHPAKALQPLELMTRGKLTERLALATSSRLPKHITERQLGKVQKKCRWSGNELQQRLVESEGPGNTIALHVVSEQASELVEVVGEKHLTAERVAGRAIKTLNTYLNTEVPVGEHLADQLLLPMALGKGGRFKTLRPSQHLLSNIEVIRQLAGINTKVEQTAGASWCISL